MGLHLFDNLFLYFIGYVDLYLSRLLLESKKFLLVKSGVTLLISPFLWGN